MKLFLFSPFYKDVAAQRGQVSCSKWQSQDLNPKSPNTKARCQPVGYIVSLHVLLGGAAGQEGRPGWMRPCFAGSRLSLSSSPRKFLVQGFGWVYPAYCHMQLHETRCHWLMRVMSECHHV